MVDVLAWCIILLVCWLLGSGIRWIFGYGGYLDRREERREQIERDANRDPEEFRREAVAAHIERNRAEHALWEHHWRDYTGGRY